MIQLHNLSKYFKMRCPNCKSVLQKGEQKRFENSADHCLDPNGEYERPLRDTWTCLKCEFKDFGYWDEQGGFYGGGMKYYQKYPNLRKTYFSALFSWDWLYLWDEKIREIRRKFLRLWRNKY